MSAYVKVVLKQYLMIEGIQKYIGARLCILLGSLVVCLFFLFYALKMLKVS